jgi:hypothetical protein
MIGKRLFMIKQPIQFDDQNIVPTLELLLQNPYLERLSKKEALILFRARTCRGYFELRRRQESTNYY